MVAGKLAKLPHGGAIYSHGGERNIEVGITTSTPSLEKAAKLLNVHRETALRGRRVHEHGAPVLIAACERGEISLHPAKEIATLPHEEQAAIVAKGKTAVVQAVK